MATHRFANSMSSALRHPGVIALIVAGLTIAAMVIVDHGPWNRAKTQPAHVAMYATTGEAAHAAGAKVLPTAPKSPVEPERPGRFDVDAARDLGITDARDFGRLQRGETVAIYSECGQRAGQCAPAGAR